MSCLHLHPINRAGIKIGKNERVIGLGARNGKQIVWIRTRADSEAAISGQVGAPVDLKPRGTDVLPRSFFSKIKTSCRIHVARITRKQLKPIKIGKNGL